MLTPSDRFEQCLLIARLGDSDVRDMFDDIASQAVASVVAENHMLEFSDSISFPAPKVSKHASGRCFSWDISAYGIHHVEQRMTPDNLRLVKFSLSFQPETASITIRAQAAAVRYEQPKSNFPYWSSQNEACDKSFMHHTVTDREVRASRTVTIASNYSSQKLSRYFQANSFITDAVLQVAKDLLVYSQLQ